MAETITLQSIGLKVAAQLRLIRIAHASKTFPNSQLAADIKVFPVIKGDTLSFRTTTVPWGKFQDLGTLGNRAKTRQDWIPNPARRRRGIKWDPSGIKPSFWKSIGADENAKVAALVKKEVGEYVRQTMPKITIKAK
jgi:hypothetical protein